MDFQLLPDTDRDERLQVYDMIDVKGTSQYIQIVAAC